MTVVKCLTSFGFIAIIFDRACKVLPSLILLDQVLSLICIKQRGCILNDEKRCSGGRLLQKEEKFMIARLRDGNFFEDSFGKLQPQTKILETVSARFLEPDLSNMELC